MIEILPIKSLTDEEVWIFGSLNVSLGKLARAGLPVGRGIVITPPEFKLKTILEHFDFGSKEVFEQSLNLVKKEIYSLPVPEILKKETNFQKHLFLSGEIVKSNKDLWKKLLETWLNEIKDRLWKNGFYPGITQNLTPQIVIFIKKIEGWGTVFFDTLQEDSVINIKQGKIHPNDLKKLDEVVRLANKKLFIPHEYEWIIDGGVKLTKVLSYTPLPNLKIATLTTAATPRNDKLRSAVKVFLDFSTGLVIEKEVDGVYISSEKIFDLNEQVLSFGNKPRDSFENLVFKLVECATTYPSSPILFKLADIPQGYSPTVYKSEGMGKVRGALRLLHQKSLFDPLIAALDFTRYKKNLTNIHIVIPFVRAVSELMQIKRELAVKKLMRKNSLKQWLEIAVPENIVNLEDYLVTGLDGIVLNLDELIAYLNGFDHLEQELTFYKNEVDGLIKFLEDGCKLMHKVKIPFIAVGSLTHNPKVLEFLIAKGIYGVVVERYEAPSAHELLYQAERRMILKRA